MHLLGFLAFLSLLWFPFVALAQDNDAMFRQVDTNQDSAISLEESNRAASAAFSGLDANNDGKITRLEYTGKMKDALAERDVAEDERLRAERILSQRFTAIDEDQDDVISQFEFLHDNERQQKEMDLNADGKVTQEEITGKQEQWREDFKKKREEQRKNKKRDEDAEDPKSEDLE